MAIVFSMEISFLNEEYSLREVQKILKNNLIDKGRIKFHTPDSTFVTKNGRDPRQIGIIPKNIGIAVSFDPPGEQIIPTEEESLYIIETMYKSVKDLPHYKMALAGWEISYLDNLFEYDENGNKKSITEIEGLVVCNELLKNCTQDLNNWAKFDEEHSWIPYSSIDEFCLMPE